MNQLGERLRQARESQGLSVEQAAVETRIRQQSLRALEEGKFDLLPNDVVAKGFIRNYAQLLGLPVDEMIDLYRLERGGSQPIRVVPTSSMRGSRSCVLPSFFGVFFVTVALVGLTYVALSALGRVREDSIAVSMAAATTITAATPTQLNTPIPATIPVPGGNPQLPPSTVPVAEVSTAERPVFPTAVPTIPPMNPAGGNAQPTSRSRSTTTPTATPAAPIVVRVNIPPGPGEGSWLRVQTDGVIAYEQIMRSGEEQVFLAQRQVQIRAGNPTFVQVSVNGLQPEVLGQVPGEPVDWSWPPQ